jgi:cytochrome b involved in lipid metabolism
MWHIYNKSYDLTSFLDKHPGGKDILLKTKDQKDVTALFETYHAFADKEKIKQILNKYENTESNVIPSRQYDFNNYNLL